MITIYDDLLNQIRKINTNDISDEIGKPTIEIIEEQKIYIWIRLYLKDENPNVSPGSDVTIKYTLSGEELKTKFICYGKKGLDIDHENEMVNYSPDDDKRILCLMIDTKMVNSNDSIPFIRTLFKTGHHYEYQLVKREELLFVVDVSDVILDYYDVDF